MDAVLRNRKSVPLVVLAYSRGELAHDPERCASNRFRFTDRAGAAHEYMLDGAVLSSVPTGHAIAGITCGGRRLLLDSNMPAAARLGAGYDPRFHAYGRPRRHGPRVRVYDWRSSARPVRMLTAPDRLAFSGTDSPKLCFYYHRGILDRAYGAGRLAAETWMRYMAEHGADARPPSAVRAQLREAMKRAFRLDA